MTEGLPDADTATWLKGRRILPEEDRARFVALMGATQASEVSDGELRALFRDTVSAPARAGITVRDFTDGLSGNLINRAVQYPVWQISFAAFFLNGFWVPPLDANDALTRSQATQTGAAAAIWETYCELLRCFDVSTTDAQNFGLTPEDITLRMFRDKGAPAALTAAMLANQKRLGNELQAVRAELKRQSEFVAADQRAPRGSNDTRIALFLLAKADGLFEKSNLKQASEKLHARLEAKLADYRRVRAAQGQDPLEYELPTPETLGNWIERGADGVRDNMKAKPGRPKKTIGK